MSVVPEPEKVLAEMVRVVRPGGRIVTVNHFAVEGGVRGAFEKWLSRFGKRLGWISLGRLGLSAVAPFALSVALGAIGPKPSVWILACAGFACVAVFGEIWRRSRAVPGLVASPRAA